MSSSNVTSSRICPVCDAKNSNLSVFCAECGASLNVPAEGDTAAFEPIASKTDEAQQTASFEPTTPGSQFGASSPQETATTLPTVAKPDPVTSLPSTWSAGSSPAVASDQVWPVQTSGETQADSTEQTLGMRGFFLGLIAALLILAVILAWSWASILDQDTRDSITDFFGFIG